jgi:hypothetical protein
VIDPSVTQLPGQPPFERLNVGDDRLGFDHQPPARTTDQGIPRAEVTLDRQRDLGPPLEARLQVASQPLEEPRLPGIPDRVAGGVRAEPDFEPHHGSKGADVANPDCVESAALESPDPDVVDSSRCFDRTKAQARPRPRSTDLGRDLPQVSFGLSPASIGRSFAGRHNRIIHGTASPGLTSIDAVSAWPTSDDDLVAMGGWAGSRPISVSRAETRIVDVRVRTTLVGPGETGSGRQGSGR